MLATLQKSAVSAGRDDRADTALRERRRRTMDTPGEAEKDAEGKITRELLGAARHGQRRTEERKRGAVDCSPNGSREGAIDQEVAEGLRNPPVQQAAAEEAVSVGRTTAAANMVSVVHHPKQGVSGCHSHEGTV